MMTTTATTLLAIIATLGVTSTIVQAQITEITEQLKCSELLASISPAAAAATGLRGGTSKGGEQEGSSPPSCTVLPVLWKYADVPKYKTDNSVGFTVENLPLYDPTTGKVLGHMFESATRLPSGDCVGHGVFRLNNNTTNTNNGLIPSGTQIFGQLTCRGTSNAITGGTGDFGCASGIACLAESTAHNATWNYYVCGDLCPVF